MKRYLIGLGFAVTMAVAAHTPAQASCGSGGVFVFETQSCPYCVKVKMLLARHGVAFRTIDASNPRVRAFMIEKFKTMSVPVTAIDNAHVVGFNESMLRHRLCLG